MDRAAVQCVQRVKQNCRVRENCKGVDRKREGFEGD